MKKLIILLIAAAVVVVGYLLPRGDEEAMAPAQEETAPLVEEQPVAAQPATNVTVTYVNNDFSPESVTVAVGQSITFVNNHSVAIRVSSNPHPIHTSYRQLESGSIAPGGNYTFTAIEKVTIKYHNHLNPNAGGEIIVE